LKSKPNTYFCAIRFKTKISFMNKILCTFLAFLMMVQATEVAAAIPHAKDPIPSIAGMTVEQFKKLSPKKFQQLTGKKLNIVQKLAFKAAQKSISKKAAAGGKSQVTALILALLVGVLGIHRFYLGYTWQGIVQLLTFGGFGIWALIDLIRIITGDLQPKDSEYTTTL
jgi:TM2 domain-containing membrane protein YozV